MSNDTQAMSQFKLFYGWGFNVVAVSCDTWHEFYGFYKPVKQIPN